MLTELDISDDLVIDYYEEIDAYSQGRHRTLKSDFTAINMGKNDLWIAATAAAFDLTLVTTDGDFDHLDGGFFEVDSDSVGGLSNEIDRPLFAKG